jgi:hypothetical protein
MEWQYGAGFDTRFRRDYRSDRPITSINSDIF